MSARYERVNARDDDDHGDDHNDNNDNGNNTTESDSLFSPNPIIPNSPPPSFRSRTSSQSPHGGNASTSSGRRHGTASIHTTKSVVDPTLADAFDTDGDNDSEDSDDEDADDRQRLMRSRDALRPMRAPAWMTTPAAAPNAAADSSDTGSNQETPASTSSQTSTPSPAPAAPTRRPAAAPASSGATPTTGRVYGGGIQSDGVFSNLTARPEPGEEKDELPPVSPPSPPTPRCISISIIM